MTRRLPSWPGQVLLEGELDAFLAAVFDVGEADDVRRGLAFGVAALVFAHLVHALDAERQHLLGQLLVDLAAQPDEVRAVVELGRELLGAHAEQPRQLRRAAPASASRSFGIAHSDGVGTLSGEDQAVAVGDAAAAGGQLERARIAHLALLLEEVGADDLHVGGAAEQHAESPRRPARPGTRAPRRRLRRQQRAGRVVDAAQAADAAGRRRTLVALHRCAPAGWPRCTGSGSRRTGDRRAGDAASSTYCVTAGVGAAHRQLLARRLLDPQRRGLRLLLGLQALVLDVELARLGLRAVEPANRRRES